MLLPTVCNLIIRKISFIESSVHRLLLLLQI